MSAIDVLANDATATVTSGGTTTSGSDNAFVVSSASQFGSALAKSSTTPPTQFRIIDQASPGEIMIVTNQSGSGGVNWTVTRGAEGTTKIAHGANWTAVGVATAAGLENMTPGSVNSVNGATGTVVLDYTDVGADPAGAAALCILSSAADSGADVEVSGGLLVVQGTANVEQVARNAVTFANIPAPTAAVDFNGQKIINLAAATASGNAAIFEQLPGATVLTSGTSFTPTESGTFLVIAVGGGGGGGGGGSTTSASGTATGGGGGGCGGTAMRLVTLTAESAVTYAIGAAGGGGNGGAAAGSNAGTGGVVGGSTTFGTTVVAFGGGAGGGGATSNAATSIWGGLPAGAGLYGLYGEAQLASGVTSISMAGAGGLSNAPVVNGAGNGSLPGAGFAAGSGGGGGNAGNTGTSKGGNAGGPGTGIAGGAAGFGNGLSGTQSTGAGQSATAAATTDYGAGGGGGGGGNNSLAAGNGGAGAPGCIIVIGPLV